jgi:membrane-associated phospholipid phosphatase
MTNQIVGHFGARLDVFPSLHAALSVYLLFWQAEHHRVEIFWGLPAALGIWLSTIYLGFHYFPDLVSGGVLGVAAFFLAPFLERRFHRWKDSLGPQL